MTSLQLASSEVEQLQLRGSSMCRAFQAGAKFTLTGHYSTAANTAYVLRSVSHHLEVSTARYRNRFVAFPASATFRPPRVTPQSIIRGAQTAIVVGKSGEEIWTDQYGRVKVKFHWDQSTAQDETSSCWIRVAQPWAGQQWGGFFLPRIGQEVIISFLDGNPDRPIITGSVYNGQQTPPYGLPDEQTKSTIKSNSSKGGSGFNELRFDDKQGSEEVFFQAQKDMNINILGDQAITVANNRKVTVTGDETHTNSGKFTHTVNSDYVLNISGNLKIQVSGAVSIESGTTFDIKAGTALTNKSGTSLTNQAGTSMSNEAQMSISSKATAQHSIESSGVLELKGSLVKIN
jgi:type VI secretion system secreted protein VgrG